MLHSRRFWMSQRDSLSAVSRQYYKISIFSLWLGYAIKAFADCTSAWANSRERRANADARDEHPAIWRLAAYVIVERVVRPFLETLFTSVTLSILFHLLYSFLVARGNVGGVLSRCIVGPLQGGDDAVDLGDEDEDDGGEQVFRAALTLLTRTPLPMPHQDAPLW